MVTKFDVGDELYLKFKVANIFTDRTGTKYSMTIVAGNGENLAGSVYTFDENILSKISNERVEQKTLKELVDNIVEGLDEEEKHYASSF